MPLEKEVINWIVDYNIDYSLTKEDLKGKIISRTWMDVGKEIASELVNLNNEKNMIFI